MELNKNGVSPLIAVVLLIGFTIILATLTITWGSRLFKSTAESTDKDSRFNLLCTTGYNVEYHAKKLVDGNSAIIEVDARNNNERSIPGFLFVLRSKDDSSESLVVDPGNTVGLSGTPGAAVSPIAGLASFSQKTYFLTPSRFSEWNELDVRYIAGFDDEFKVCENEFTLVLGEEPRDSLNVQPIEEEKLEINSKKSAENITLFLSSHAGNSAIMLTFINTTLGIIVPKLDISLKPKGTIIVKPVADVDLPLTNLNNLVMILVLTSICVWLVIDEVKKRRSQQK